MIGGWLALVGLATLVDGLLAGASLDQSIKQLPARHRMGVVQFSEYSQAADLGHGVVWYAALGIGGALLTLVAAGLAVVLNVPPEQRLLLVIAGALAIAHSVTTARAAPINFSQRAVRGNQAALAGIFTQFERWQTLRAGLQLATFSAMVWALALG
jgi:hypothetical protein